MAKLLTFRKMKSVLILNYLSRELCIMASSILETLIMSDLNSENGITLSLDRPYGCKQYMPNLTRPAVLRQHYGLTLSNGTRCCYGNGTGSLTVGSTPQTREMTKGMIILAHAIKHTMKHVPRYKESYMNLTFNHCTVLLYYHKSQNSPNQMLGFHTDMVYSKINGKYCPTKNSQTEGTPTCIVTIGGSRKVCFQKQRYMYNKESKSMKWHSQKKLTSIKLNHNSMFVLHPEDEIPFEMNGVKERWRHGVPHYDRKDELSMALIFRSVKNTSTTDSIATQDAKLTTNQYLKAQMSHQRLQTLFQDFYMMGNKVDWK